MATAAKKGSKADALRNHKAKKATPAKKGATKSATKAPAKKAAVKAAPAKKEAPKKVGKEAKVEMPTAEQISMFQIPVSPTIKIKEILADLIPTQKEVAQHQTHADELVDIPVADIRTRPGFNKRKEWGDIEGLANSMNEYGQVLPIRVDAYKDGDNVIYILDDGERRFKAKLHLVNQGGDIAEKHKTVRAIVNHRETTEKDRLLMQSLSNSGKPFEPIEEAELFRELRDKHKMQPIEIARNTGNSIARVEQLLLLADNSEEVKEAVRSGKVSGTAVIELSRNEKNQSKRDKLVKDAVTSGTKLKVKDVKKGSPAGGGTKGSAPATKKVDSKVKDLVDEAIALAKQADKENANQKVRAILFDLEAKIRAIKKAL